MKDVIKFLDNYLTENDIVVCATSGGVDSMSLLSMLKNYNKDLKIICAHVNHNLREESFEEYEFVKKYCTDNNIVFEGTILEKDISGNLESEFRNRRYNFLEEIVSKYNAKYLFTAHHGDDLVETVLMRITRGSTLEGYSGFNKVVDKENYKILRPLVYLSKDDIYKYAKDNNIEYREDKTNESDDYTRNRFRKYILTKLKEENKNVHSKFLKYNEDLNSANCFINRYVFELLKNNYYDNKLDLDSLINQDDFILKRVLYEITKFIYGDKINLLTDNNIEEIIKIIRSNKPNLQIDLPIGIVVTKKYDILEFKVKTTNEEYKIEIKEEDIKLPVGELKIIKETDLTSNYVCHLNSKEVKLPLYVRNRKDGDYIEVLGLNGKKKVKDIFIDEKLSKEERDIYPIVVDSDDNVVWIPGIKKSKYNSLKNKNYDIILWYTKEEDDE